MLAAFVAIVATTPLASSSPIGQAQDSVFQLITQNISGSGFLISNDGWAITNHHVIAGTSVARARFENDERRYDVELWKVREDLDLALVRVKLARPKRALRIAERDPLPGDEVWTAGYPRFGYTVSRGIISGIRAGRNMPGRDWKPDAVMLQTDATMNPGNSGGPMIQSDGKVVGINTWGMREDDSTYFAISAQHIQSLMDNRPSDPIPFPNAPARPETRDQPEPPQRPEAPPPRPPRPDQPRFPTPEPPAPERPSVPITRDDLPTIDIDRPLPPSQLLNAANTLERQIECRACRGDGRVTVRVHVGWETEGVFRRRIYENREQDCSRCDGTGLSLSGVPRHLQRMARAMAMIDTEHARTEHTIEHAADILRQAYRHAGDQIWDTVRDEVRPPRRGLIGNPVVAVGTTHEEVFIPELNGHVHFVSDGDRTYICIGSRVHLHNSRMPGIQDKEDMRLTIGGMLTGFLDGEQSREYPVIYGGFVISH